MRFYGVRALSLLAAIGGVFLLQAIVLGVDNEYVQRLVVLAGLYVTLSVSLNLINGITGQFSIGHAAFYQVGAYTAGYVTLSTFHRVGPNNPLWLALMIVVGALAAGVAGFVVGLPSLRLRGDYLAIVTLGFGEIIRIIVQNQESLGGSYGLQVPKPQFHFIWMIWLLAILCIAVCRNLLKTAHGLPFLAVREDEVASAAMGVNVTIVKVTAFVIGSMFAGAAGALLCHYEGFITPMTFGMNVSFIILTMVVLGGTGSITGSALAAIFLAYLPEYLRGLKGPNGPLMVSGASVVGALLAAAVVVASIRWTMENHHGSKTIRSALYVGLILLGIVLKVILGFVLSQLPVLARENITADQLRMLIFAVTLIVLMLLRPQGVFAHHEFSWSWVRKLFGARKVPETEVAV